MNSQIVLEMADATVPGTSQSMEKVFMPLEPLPDETSGPDHVPPPTRVSVTKDKKGSYVPLRQDRLRNNLHFAVGLLELANAGDFAANIWNVVPVPVYATVFMAIGGTAAGVLSVFAFRDAILAWANIRFLRRQWKQAKQRRQHLQESGLHTHDIDVLLTLTFRELGTEFINRLGMDVLMGGGAVLISIGTYMAIGGENRTVFEVSNILSGYLGNTPIALYGLVNFLWGMYIWSKAREHTRAARKSIKGTKAFVLVKRRSFLVQLYCAVNGTATLVGGVGSMLTATRWWAYVILIPVIISSFVCNLFWRKRIGYTRDCTDGEADMSSDRLICALYVAVSAESKLRNDKTGRPALTLLGKEGASLSEVIAFIQDNGLLEEYCIRLVSIPEIREHVSAIDHETSDTELTVSTDDLVNSQSEYHSVLIQAAQDCIRDVGSRHFTSRERYLSEVLGISLALSNASTTK